MSKRQLIEQVLSLSVSDRAGVALEILESFSPEDSVDDQALLTEAERRDREMDLNNENTLIEEQFLNSFDDRMKRLG